MDETVLLTSTGSIALLKEPGDATGCVIAMVPENVNNVVDVAVETYSESMVCVLSN